jgi:hypothetical protein
MARQMPESGMPGASETRLSIDVLSIITSVATSIAALDNGRSGGTFRKTTTGVTLALRDEAGR